MSTRTLFSYDNKQTVHVRKGSCDTRPDTTKSIEMRDCPSTAARYTKWSKNMAAERDIVTVQEGGLIRLPATFGVEAGDVLAVEKRSRVCF